MIYNYLLLTIKLTYFLYVRFMQMAADVRQYNYMSLNILGSAYSYMNYFLSIKTNIWETAFVVL
jgi:hypothetical protein